MSTEEKEIFNVPCAEYQIGTKLWYMNSQGAYVERIVAHVIVAGKLDEATYEWTGSQFLYCLVDPEDSQSHKIRLRDFATAQSSQDIESEGFRPSKAEAFEAYKEKRLKGLNEDIERHQNSLTELNAKKASLLQQLEQAEREFSV